MASIVDYLKSKNLDSSFQNRAKLAKLYGILNYKGSAKLNTDLLKFLQSSSATNNTNVSDEEIELALANLGTSDIVVTPVKKVNPDYNNQVWNYMSHFRDSKGVGNGIPTKEEARVALEKYGKYLTPEQRGVFINLWDLNNFQDVTPYTEVNGVRLYGETPSKYAKLLDEYAKDWEAGEQAMERLDRLRFEQSAPYHVLLMALQGIPLTDANLRKYIPGFDLYWTPEYGKKINSYVDEEMAMGNKRMDLIWDYQKARNAWRSQQSKNFGAAISGDINTAGNKILNAGPVALLSNSTKPYGWDFSINNLMSFVPTLGTMAGSRGVFTSALPKVEKAAVLTLPAVQERLPMLYTGSRNLPAILEKLPMLYTGMSKAEVLTPGVYQTMPKTVLPIGEHMMNDGYSGADYLGEGVKLPTFDYTPKTKILTVGGYQGSPEFQTAFGNARKQGLSEFTFGGKRYNTGLGNGGTQDIEVKDVRGMTEYLPISSGVLNYDNTAVPALGAGYKGGVGLRSQYPMHKQGGKINYFNLFQ